MADIWTLQVSIKKIELPHQDSNLESSGFNRYDVFVARRLHHWAMRNDTYHVRILYIIDCAFSFYSFCFFLPSLPTYAIEPHETYIYNYALVGSASLNFLCFMMYSSFLFCFSLSCSFFLCLRLFWCLFQHCSPTATNGFPSESVQTGHS